MSSLLNQLAKIDTTYQELQDEGWDGASAQPIDELIAEKAAVIVSFLTTEKGLPVPDDVLPCPCGGLEILWGESINLGIENDCFDRMTASSSSGDFELSSEEELTRFCNEFKKPV